MTPPPMMGFLPGWPSMQTTINTLFPKLFPVMAKATPGVVGMIDIFTGLGGVPDWQAAFPKSCSRSSRWPPCKWFCDERKCDQIHPNKNGYAHLAAKVYEGLGLRRRMEEVIL